MTAQGRLLLGSAGTFGVLGLILGYPEVIALGLMLGCLVLLAWLLTLRRPSIQAERVLHPTHVTRTRSARATLTVRNGGNRAVAGLVGQETVGEDSVAFDVPRLSASGTSEIEYALPTGRRGVIVVGPALFVNKDPWGVFERARPVPGSTQLFVRPLTHQVTAPGKGVQRALDGGETNRALEGSSTFHAIREYVPGDDRRRIHWRSTARTGVMMVRQHVDLARPEVLIGIELASQPGDPFESALELAASVASAALRERSPVRLVTSSGIDELFETPDQEAALLDALTVLQPAGGPIDPTWLPGAAAAHSGSAAIVVTTDEQASAVGAAAFLCSRYGFVVLPRLNPETFAITAQGVHVIGADSGATLSAVWNGRFTR